MLNYPIVQIAYFVNDAQESAKTMSKQFGAGPFFFVPRIELAWGTLRGEDCNFLHSSAFGQWGNIMVEFVQQDEEGSSPFRELYAPGEEGIHHVAMMVDSMEQTYLDSSDMGVEVVCRAETLTGTEFAFLRADKLGGHLIEIYEKSEQLLGFYSMVKEASLGWDGSEPIRTVG